MTRVYGNVHPLILFARPLLDGELWPEPHGRAFTLNESVDRKRAYCAEQRERRRAKYVFTCLACLSCFVLFGL